MRRAQRSGRKAGRGAGREKSGAGKPPGQPIIRSTLRRFAYAGDRTDWGVTGHAGLLTGIEAFHALGAAKSRRRELKLKKRRRGLTEAEWVELFVMLYPAGGVAGGHRAA